MKTGKNVEAFVLTVLENFSVLIRKSRKGDEIRVCDVMLLLRLCQCDWGLVNSAINATTIYSVTF